jgi:hypothetical protein
VTDWWVVQEVLLLLQLSSVTGLGFGLVVLGLALWRRFVLYP